MGLIAWYRRFVVLITVIYSIATGIIAIFMIALSYLLKYKELGLFNVLLSKATETASESLSENNYTVPEMFPEAYTKIKSYAYDSDVLGGNSFIVLLTLGTFLLSISIWGCAIGRQSSRCAVLSYTVVTILITLALMTTFLLLKYLIERDMHHTMNDYKGLSDTSLKGITWNTLMLGLGCCGVEGYKDFQQLEHWPPTDGQLLDKDKILKYLNLSIPSTIENASTALASKSCAVWESVGAESLFLCKFMDPKYFLTPMACCKSINDIILGCHLKGTANETNNWMDLGCHTKVMSYISDQGHMHVIFALVLLFMLSYCIILIFRIIVGAQPNKSSDQEVISPVIEKNKDKKECARVDSKTSIMSGGSTKKSVRFSPSVLSRLSISSSASTSSEVPPNQVQSFL